MALLKIESIERLNANNPSKGYNYLYSKEWELKERYGVTVVDELFDNNQHWQNEYDKDELKKDGTY